ncbi:MAG: hypothetical protein FWC16_14745 [Defluviitaleaceae bacterium]|nr:hypothetical protein [Defluviitaleaceae bacterium]MCL2276173.1 hypothetical protein [Defluviitaleaceae bacterium]
MTIPQQKITAYRNFLVTQNKSKGRVGEYIRYVNRFAAFTASRPLDTALTEEYRQHIDTYYSTYNSKNNCVFYINAFLKFLNREELLIAYFPPNRAEVKIKTAALTDEDINKLLHYTDVL